MSIDAIGLKLRGLQEIQQTPSIVNDKAAESGAGKESFSDMMSNAMQEVDSLQTEANKQIEGLSMQRDGFTTHGAMIALEKADVAFQLMNNIRSKIVRAYEDIMRTQV